MEPSDAGLLDNKWMRVGVARTVPAAPDVVWAKVGDESTWLSWYKPLSAFDPIGEPTTGIGATFQEQEWLWKTESRVVTKDAGRKIGLSTHSINMPGLLTSYYRSISVDPGENGSSTLVAISGAFRFGPLGWLLFPYTYPQMNAAMYFEYRSALKGLAELVLVESKAGR